jgi:hypothetical protein
MHGTTAARHPYNMAPLQHGTATPWDRSQHLNNNNNNDNKQQQNTVAEAQSAQRCSTLIFFS